jgi:hypothetical protein
MPDPSDNTSKNSDERESVFKIMDDLISHMNTTRNLFIVLIVSSFVIAPVILITVAIVFTPPEFLSTDNIIMRTEKMPHAKENLTSQYEGKPPPPKGEMPVGNVTGSEFPIPAPKGEFTFFKIQSKLQESYLADITTVVAVLIATSVILASLSIFIGIKEYRFFSRWSKRYSEYVSSQKRVEEKLDEGEKEEE